VAAIASGKSRRLCWAGPHATCRVCDAFRTEEVVQILDEGSEPLCPGPTGDGSLLCVKAASACADAEC
jgi:hypothetical protein